MTSSPIQEYKPSDTYDTIMNKGLNPNSSIGREIDTDHGNIMKGIYSNDDILGSIEDTTRLSEDRILEITAKIMDFADEQTGIATKETKEWGKYKILNRARQLIENIAGGKEHYSDMIRSIQENGFDDLITRYVGHKKSEKQSIYSGMIQEELAKLDYNQKEAIAKDLSKEGEDHRDVVVNLENRLLAELTDRRKRMKLVIPSEVQE